MPSSSPSVQFTPANWYWIVNNSTTQVYSSKIGDYVSAADPTYLSWVTTTRKPTRITSEADLGAVLASYRFRPVAANVLDGYLTQQAQTIVDMTQFKILFNHENRTRAIERALALNGSPPNLTPAQARNAVKALL